MLKDTSISMQYRAKPAEGVLKGRDRIRECFKEWGYNYGNVTGQDQNEGVYVRAGSE